MEVERSVLKYILDNVMNLASYIVWTLEENCLIVWIAVSSLFFMFLLVDTDAVSKSSGDGDRTKDVRRTNK